MTTDTSTGEMFETEGGSSVVVRHMIAKINGIVPKILFPFVAKQDIRYYLNGINIRPLIEGGVMISASDGHRLIVVRDPEGFVDREIIVSVLKDGLKHGTADGEFIVMSDGASWWQSSTASPLFIQPGNSLIDGQFPRFEGIFRNSHRYTEGIRGAFNPSYLRDALAIDTGSQTPSIRFWTNPHDEHSPLIFKVDQVAGLEAVGAVMSLRGQADRIPTWIPMPGDFELTRELDPAPPKKPVKDTPVNTVGNNESPE